MNVFEEYEDEIEDNREDLIKAPRNGYLVTVRFRNQKDYEEFADLLEQPALKVYTRNKTRTTTWPTPKSETSLFDL